MRLYKKEIKPIKVTPSFRGSDASYFELENWQPEENRKFLLQKYKTFKEVDELEILERFTFVKEE